jgi:AraC-like DNA-binding protein
MRKKTGNHPINDETQCTIPEAGTWVPFPGGWRQLYGDFPSMGVSVELHDFTPRKDFDWAQSFHPESIEICLNLEGEGVLTNSGKSIILGPSSVAAYAIGNTPLAAERKGGQRHRFITVELSRVYLRNRFPEKPAGLLPLIDGAFHDGPMPSGLAAIRPFTAAQSTAYRGIAEPPVHPLALPLWYEARLAEWLAECLFTPEDELFCHRQHRTDRERIERTKSILAAEFIEPPSLAVLAQRVGVSSFYLSRTFSRVAGETIAQHIRRLRIERAAELLRKGTHNVTEAAFEVGYSSLGHFARNFTEVLGRPPSAYGEPRLK